MKKVMVLSMVLLSAVCARATGHAALQEAAEMAARLEKARVVKYVVTLYCDEEKMDHAEWQETIARAVESLTLGQSETAQEAEVIDSVIRALEALKTKKRSSVLAGSISIGLGDGKCSPDKCGQNCRCTKDGGVCGCSAINGEQCCK